MVRKDLTGKITSEQRPEGGAEGENHVISVRKVFHKKGTSIECFTGDCRNEFYSKEHRKPLEGSEERND